MGPADISRRTKKRSVIENSILAFRPEDARKYQWDPPDARQALADLAAATNIPRLVKHRRLIDGLRRSSAEVRADLDGHLRDTLASTLKPGLSDDGRQRLADRAKAGWTRWRRHRATNGSSRGTRSSGCRTRKASSRSPRMNRPLRHATMSSRRIRPRPAGKSSSRLIVAQFWSELPPTAFRTYVNPRNWPQCSPFWRAMQPLGPIGQRADDYDGDFAETVNIVGETLTVPLRIGFRVSPDQSRVWARFNISRTFYNQFPDTKVDVDTGTVSAELVSGGPAQTRVRATKYLHWRDPNRPDLTELACDYGWADLMEEMADGCVQGFPADGGQAEGAGRARSTVTGGAQTSAGAAVKPARRVCHDPMPAGHQREQIPSRADDRTLHRLILGRRLDQRPAGHGTGDGAPVRQRRQRRPALRGLAARHRD